MLITIGIILGINGWMMRIKKTMFFLLGLMLTNGCYSQKYSFDEVVTINPEKSDFFGVRVFMVETDTDISIKLKANKKNSKTNLNFIGFSISLSDESMSKSIADLYLEVCDAGDGIGMTSFRIEKSIFPRFYLSADYRVLDEAVNNNEYNITSNYYDWDIEGLTENRRIDMAAFLTMARSVTKGKRTDQNWLIGIGVDSKHPDNELFDKSLECM